MITGRTDGQRAPKAMNRKLEETKSNLQEEVDKEARRDNIIIYRMPESVSDSNEERKLWINVSFSNC